MAVILLFAGCSKDYNTTLPQVEFNSVTPFGNDSAILTGTVISSGNTAIEYVGFSYSSQPSFDILSNQILLNGVAGKFSCAVMLKPDSTYYFKSFAANDQSYAVSQAFKYTASSPNADSASCGLSDNEIIDNNTHYNGVYVYYGGGYASVGTYGVEANDITGYESLNIQFNGTPQTATYTSQSDVSTFQSNPYQVYITVTQGSFTTYTINSGGTVYVAKNANGSVTVSFCSLSYTVVSTNVFISAKLNY